jgi:hypothetical protein
MTHTRATSPTLISSHSIYTATNRTSLQVTAMNGNNDFSDNMRIGLPSIVMHGIIVLDLYPSGGNDDYDGGIAYSRRCCTHSQVEYLHCQGVTQDGRTRRLQNWQAVEDQTRSVAGIYRQAITRQEINVGVCQYSKVVHQLSAGVQSIDNWLSSTYPCCIYYSDTSDGVSSLAMLLSTRIDTMWVARKGTHMFTTIGISPQSAYPYNLINSAPAIFGVCGSEVETL